jgi:hypothetical protein
MHVCMPAWRSSACSAHSNPFIFAAFSKLHLLFWEGENFLPREGRFFPSQGSMHTILIWRTHIPQHSFAEFEAGMHYLLDPKGADMNPTLTHPGPVDCTVTTLTSAEVWGFSFAASLIGAVMSLSGALMLLPFLFRKGSASVTEMVGHVGLTSSFAVSSFYFPVVTNHGRDTERSNYVSSSSEIARP